MTPQTDLVDATPARQQLRELVARGWPVTHIAQHIDTPHTTIVNIYIGRGSRTNRYLARAIARAHEELIDADPATCGVRTHLSRRARRSAALHGWGWQPAVQHAGPLPAEAIARFQNGTRKVGWAHLEWDGPSHFMVLGQQYRPPRIAFTLRTGREPIGGVRPECGHPGCVAPDHVEDQPGRVQTRKRPRDAWRPPAA
ncbi:MAG: hypothetical protein HOW97_08125 [Catenulispora sp.]|nr:hypothetical protein [Catenulispora sp.]